MLLVDYSAAYLRRIPRDSRQRLVPGPIPNFWGKDTHSGWHTLMPVEQVRFAHGEPGATEKPPAVTYLIGWNDRTGAVAKIDRRTGQLSGGLGRELERRETARWDDLQSVCYHGTVPEFLRTQAQAMRPALQQQLNELHRRAQAFAVKWGQTEVKHAPGKVPSAVANPLWNEANAYNQAALSLRGQACSYGHFDLERTINGMQAGVIHGVMRTIRNRSEMLTDTPGAYGGFWESLPREVIVRTKEVAAGAADIAAAGATALKSPLAWVALAAAGIAALVILR